MTYEDFLKHIDEIKDLSKSFKDESIEFIKALGLIINYIYIVIVFITIFIPVTFFLLLPTYIPFAIKYKKFNFFK